MKLEDLLGSLDIAKQLKKLEGQVVSLELAKRLKELGVKQDSLFYYCYSKRLEEHSIRTKDEFINYNKQEDYMTLDYSAFTVAELGEMLPIDVPFTTLHKENGSCVISTIKQYQLGNNESKSEADARAKMLIYLLENKLM